ncbi:uncharacterized protein TRIVIDRAFT_63196 [Trichoderma virens Gv29-8]|uniref:Small acidic protein-like domain-containing protein n=1 Tax=Hypocrea virens (strain Gv29-8 / FGSC 10586) TaxID=413071 RepID=G9MEG2_HYPVG|nr:uncharacterized protein TRIVIDRAFT_63196 [Trichoderma virens Gv29-8]EHK27443.1 hypothetical protein TRIVIDRAFT_63196 [Trichoderma virens Gv29-8]UKZ57902.1 hypothetical protein TrVGV298_011763 [Trichoderma virens]
MGKSTVKEQADAAALAEKARKAEKKARKAERKAKEKLAIDGKNPILAKKEKLLEKQLLEIETKRLQNLAESTKLEAEAKQLLQQSEDASKLAKRVAKALKKTTDGGDSQLLSNLVHDSDADSSDEKDIDDAMEDTIATPKTTLKAKANDAHEASEKENNSEKKKKDKKKKSKSKSEESNAIEEQATSAKAKADGKRKRQDDNAEQPVSKKEKKTKGGEQVAQASTEKVKIQGLEGGAARQDKFLRLLGGKKAGVSATKPGSIASNQSNSVRAEAAIQQQFEAGMMLKESGQKRRGLGA